MKTSGCNATYVSEWDSGTVVRSGCKYDAITKRVTEIESTDVEVGDASLEREYVELPDGIQLDKSNGVLFVY